MAHPPETEKMTAPCTSQDPQQGNFTTAITDDGPNLNASFERQIEDFVTPAGSSAQHADDYGPVLDRTTTLTQDTPYSNANQADTPPSLHSALDSQHVYAGAESTNGPFKTNSTP